MSPKKIGLITLLPLVLSGCGKNRLIESRVAGVTVAVAAERTLRRALGSEDAVFKAPIDAALQLDVHFQSGAGLPTRLFAVLGPDAEMTIESDGDIDLQRGWLYFRGARPWGRTTRTSGGVAGLIIGDGELLIDASPDGTGPHRIFFVSGASAWAKRVTSPGTSPDVTWFNPSMYVEQVGGDPVQLLNLNDTLLTQLGQRVAIARLSAP